MTTTISSKLHAIKLITRMDKPIGTYLLLWPTYWALWIAYQGIPDLQVLLVFSLGVFLMRSAGCVINDFADRHFDGKVKRTKARPLVTGLISAPEALTLFALLVLAAFLLVMTLSPLTFYLSFVAIFLATLYPFLKRVTYWPQLVLGLAFSWGMIMAFAQGQGKIPSIAWLLFSANVLWTLAYDTIYAMVDRDDDVDIGVKSTAILFANHDKRMVAFLQIMTLALLFTVGDMLAFGWPYQLALVIGGGLFCYQQVLIVNRVRAQCFQAFLNNHLVGLVIFCGIFIEYL